MPDTNIVSCKNDKIVHVGIALRENKKQNK